MILKHSMTPSRYELPFRVALATPADLPEILEHRALCYGKLFPELRQLLARPEPGDHPGVGRALLVARQKSDGAVVGSARVSCNAGGPTALERLADLPEPLRGARLLIGSRMSLSAGPMGAAALFKGAIEFGRLCDASHFVIAASPRMASIYLRAGFAELFDDGREAMLPMADGAAPAPHRLLGLDLTDPVADLRARRPAMADFMEADSRGDIEIGAPRLLARV